MLVSYNIQLYNDTIFSAHKIKQDLYNLSLQNRERIISQRRQQSRPTRRRQTPKALAFRTCLSKLINPTALCTQHVDISQKRMIATLLFRQRIRFNPKLLQNRERINSQSKQQWRPTRRRQTPKALAFRACLYRSKYGTTYRRYDELKRYALWLKKKYLCC